MHMGMPYGHLTGNRGVPKNRNLWRIGGCTPDPGLYDRAGGNGPVGSTAPDRRWTEKTEPALRAGGAAGRGASGVSGRRWGRTHNTKTKSVVTVERDAPVAGGRTRKVPVVEPGPAADHTE